MERPGTSRTGWNEPDTTLFPGNFFDHNNALINMNKDEVLNISSFQLMLNNLRSYNANYLWLCFT